MIGDLAGLASYPDIVGPDTDHSSVGFVAATMVYGNAAGRDPSHPYRSNPSWPLISLGEIFPSMDSSLIMISFIIPCKSLVSLRKVLSSTYHSLVMVAYLALTEFPARGAMTRERAKVGEMLPFLV